MHTATLTVPSQFALIGQPSKPGPADIVAQRAYQISLQHNELPAQWAANKWEQTNHFTGAVRLAIQPYLDAIGSARVRVLERKSRIVKSVGGGHYSRDDDYEPADPDHPLCQIIERPGGEHGAWSIGQECAYLTLQHLLTGDAPAWTPFNEAGRPVQFFAITAATVSAQFTGGNPQYPNGAYRVTPYTGGSTFYMGALATSALLPGEQVRFFRQFHPWARNWGMSALQSGALEIDILEAISRSRWSYFDQGLQLDCVVYLPGATPDEVTATKAQLEQKHGGARNSRRVLVVGGAGAIDGSGKPVSVQQLGPGARELDFNSSFEQSAGYVLAFFKTPKALVNLTETGGSYQSIWAVRQMFYDLGLQPYAGNLSTFLTQTLANPWCDFPGQFKIEVEIPQPENVETDNENWKFAVGQGLYTHNQSLRRLNLPTVGPEGDVPTPIYMAKQQQAVAPPPMPGADPMQALGEADTNADPSGAEAPADGGDTPEGAQDAITQAALASLGIGGGDESDLPPDVVEKARQARAEGSKWQGQSGQWYTKRGGKIVAIANPAGGTKPQAAQPQGKTQTAPQAAGTSPSGAHPGGIVNVRQVIEQHGKDSNKAADKIRDQLSQHLAAGGKASLWMDGKETPIAKVENGKVYDAKGAPHGLLPLAAGLPGKKTGVEFHPVQQASAPGGAEQAAPTAGPAREELHAAILKAPGVKDYGITKAILARMSESGVRSLAAQLGVGPAESLSPHVEKLPQTPAVQQAAQTAGQWAARAADKHADAVASHFGISREQAHRLLVKAITAVGEHAAKGVTIRDTRTGKTATLTRKPPANPGGEGTLPERPTVKAMSSLDDSAGGVLVPPAEVRLKKRKRKRELVDNVLKSLGVE